MVSPLWKACSEGDLENVLELLKSGNVDIEIKDHTGSTPLIEAVKNGHTEVVRALLERGVDPSNASSQGLPEQYTSDPTITELIRNAQIKMSQNGMMPSDIGFSQDPNVEAAKHYYPPPMGAYYYPGMHPVPHLPEGGMAYYPALPPQSAPGEHPAGGPGNLPPPEVASMIPCRYFPACRYGSSCIFAHPQGPYFQGPLPPPAQYPTHYDPNMSPYSSNYYAVLPPSFPSLNGMSMSPTSPQGGAHPTPPHAPMAHVRANSEVISPVQGQFSPTGLPPPVPYGAVSPLSPGYPHPGSVPIPVSIPALPPLHHSGPQGSGPQSPQAMYQNAPPFAVRRDSVGQYAPHPLPPQHVAHPGLNGGPKSPPLHPQAEGYAPPTMTREGMGHYRRGSLRKPSFGGSRKQACIFFPSGRCRNGDDCRFPHIMPPEGNGHQNNPHFPVGRGPPRPRIPPNANGVVTIEAKMADMSVRDDVGDHSSRSESTDPGNRVRPSNGPRQTQAPGPRVDKRAALRQRLPGADEFPALAGSTTPPKQSPGLNGSSGSIGPTAAQVLQAPPPTRKDSFKESIASSTPEQGRAAPPVKEWKPVAEPNGAVYTTTHEIPVNKLPISFAAVTTAAAAYDASKEVRVTA